MCTLHSSYLHDPNSLPGGNRRVPRGGRGGGGGKRDMTGLLLQKGGDGCTGSQSSSCTHTIKRDKWCTIKRVVGMTSQILQGFVPHCATADTTVHTYMNSLPPCLPPSLPPCLNVHSTLNSVYFCTKIDCIKKHFGTNFNSTPTSALLSFWAFVWWNQF